MKNICQIRPIREIIEDGCGFNGLKTDPFNVLERKVNVYGSTLTEEKKKEELVRRERGKDVV